MRDDQALSAVLTTPTTARLTAYVLDILGMTHDHAARAVIAGYTDHADPGVRRAAKDALTEPEGKPQ